MNKIYIVLFFTISSFRVLLAQNVLLITDNIQAFQALPLMYIVKGLHARKHSIHVYSEVKPILSASQKQSSKNILSKIVLDKFPTDLTNYQTVICSDVRLAKEYIYLKERPELQSLQFMTIVRGDDFTVSEYHSDNVTNKVFQLGDLFLVTSQHALYLLDLCGISEEKIELLPMPVDCLKSVFHINIVESKREIKILVVDEFLSDSGVEIACRAVEALKNVKFSCTVVCSNKKSTKLRKVYRSPRIKFVEVNSSAEFLLLLQQHHMLIMSPTTSSSGICKGVPLSILEAMAHGLLIIASRHGGISELIRNNENGYLVPERDFEMLTNTIQTALSERQSWPSKILRSREIILERYERVKVMRKLHALLVNPPKLATVGA